MDIIAVFTHEHINSYKDKFVSKHIIECVIRYNKCNELNRGYFMFKTRNINRRIKNHRRKIYMCEKCYNKTKMPHIQNINQCVMMINGRIERIYYNSYITNQRIIC